MMCLLISPGRGSRITMSTHWMGLKVLARLIMAQKQQEQFK